MADITRRAEVVWDGNLFEGSGEFSVGSGSISEMAVSWAARTEDPAGRTSPEELIAAAHASCYAMALSNTLAKGGHPPERLTVTAVVTFDPPKVTTSALTVQGSVSGLDQAAFADFARQGEEGCPVSNALRGNVEITVDATLEG